jgi:hypothetical protein
MPNRLPLTPDQLAAYQVGQAEETAADAATLTHEITRALGGVGLPLETTLDRMGESTPLTAGELGELPGDFRNKLVASHQATEELFARIGLTTPPINVIMSLARAGADPLHLGNEYNRMHQEGHQPELVLSPRLPSAQWRNVYTSLTADPAIPNNPLKEQDDGHGLYINNEVEAAWDNLDFVPEGVLVINDWTLRLIPGTPKPTQMDIDHAGNYKDGSGQIMQFQGVGHPTVNEYLTLQAIRIQSGQSPIDAQTWSWLDGTFGNNGSRAPDGRWNSGRGRVVVGCNGVGFRSGRLGVRVPVGGKPTLIP